MGLVLSRGGMGSVYNSFNPHVLRHLSSEIHRISIIIWTVILSAIQWIYWEFSPRAENHMVQGVLKMQRSVGELANLYLDIGGSCMYITLHHTTLYPNIKPSWMHQNACSNAYIRKTLACIFLIPYPALRKLQQWESDLNKNHSTLASCSSQNVGVLTT